MGCGEQGWLAASSHCRFCNPTCVAAAGHTPSGAIARREDGRLSTPYGATFL